MPCSAIRALLLLALTAQVSQAMTVETRAVADWRPVFGAVESVKRAAARVRTPGTLVSLTVAEGDAVTQGQQIARVVDDKLDLQLAALDAGLRALDAQARQAAIDLARAEELRQRGAAPAATLDAARTAADVIVQTQAARRAERDALLQRMAEGAVLAPESGRVLQVPVVQGMVLNAGETVAVIATENFVLRTRLPERHAALLALGDAVRILGRGALAGGEAAEGRIARIYPELEAGQVVADIAADSLGDYFVGERIRIEVATGQREALVVPGHFLDQRNGVTFARLDSGAEVVVQPGQVVDGGIEILAGLKAGDKLTAYRD